MGTIRIHVCTYEGNTSWEFPMKDSELDRKINATGLGTSNEIPIAGVEWPEGLYMLRGLTVDADELNFLAKRMDSFDPMEYLQFYAAAQTMRNADIRALINLSFNVGRYTLIQSVANLEEVGKRYTLNTKGSIPLKDLAGTDYAQVGRELLSSGKGIPTDYGLLFENNEVPFENVYDGTTFPPYYWRGNFVMGVLLEYNGKSELLCLPEEKISIEKAVKRLGAPSLQECTCKADSYEGIDELWQDRIECNLEYAGLHETNVLAGVLVRQDLDFGKLLRVTDYAEALCGEDIKKLADRLDDFIVIPGAKTYADVAEYIVQHESGYEAGENLTYYVDYAGLGEYIVAERDGLFIGGAFVCMADGCSYEQIMGRDNPDMEMGGM